MSSADDAIDFGVEAVSTIWRGSRGRYVPMQIPPVELQGTGRFDDTRDSDYTEGHPFGVLYCSETPLASFIEVLAPLREQLDLKREVANAVIMDVDEREHSDQLVERSKNVVSTRWQEEWRMSSATLESNAPLFDLASPAAVQYLRERLSPFIMTLERCDLDFSDILGSDRNLTGGISRWLWTLETNSGQPMFSGIRYRSRFDPECICLALYQDRYKVSDTNTQPITPETPGFAEAASILRLKIA